MPARPVCRCTPGRACRPCVLVATRADYRALWGVTAAEGAAVLARLPAGAVPRYTRPRPRCVYEGAVASYCVSCGPDKAPGRHVRQCDLFDLCTLEPVGPRVRNCRECVPVDAPDPDPPPDDF